MYKARTLLALGTWIAILPFLGLPYAWKDSLSTLTGLVLMFLSYILYRDYRKEQDKEKTFDNFKENDDFNEREVSHEEDRQPTSASEE